MEPHNPENLSPGPLRRPPFSVPCPSYLVDLLAGAFGTEEGRSFHKVFLYPPLVADKDTWGFMIATSSGEDNRLELAAFSYKIDEEGKPSSILESRRARIPLEKLPEVLEELRQRMDELDCHYHELDLTGRGEADAQMELVRQILTGDFDDTGAKDLEPRAVQPGPGYPDRGPDC